MFTSFNGVQNMVSQIFQQLNFGSLGQFALFAFSFGIGVGCLLAPRIMYAISQRAALLIGASMFAVFVGFCLLMVQCPEHPDAPFCNANFAYVSFLILSPLGGLFTGVFWFATGSYHTAVTEAVGGARSGMILGIYWSLLACAQLTGNYLSKKMLEISTQAYFGSAFLVSLLAVLMFCFVVPMVEQRGAGGKAEAPSFRRLTSLLTHRSTRPFLYFCCFGGILLSFFTTFFYRLILLTVDEAHADDEKFKNVISSNVFTALGFADFITGFIVGRLTLSFTPARLAQMHCALGLLTLTVCFAQYATSSYNLCYPAGMLWGVLDCYFNCAAGFICTQYYKGRLEIFALYRFIQMEVCALLQIFSPQVASPLLYMLLVALATYFIYTESLEIRPPTQKDFMEIDTAAGDYKSSMMIPLRTMDGVAEKRHLTEPGRDPLRDMRVVKLAQNAAQHGGDAH
jgi:MFS family permease